MTDKYRDRVTPLLLLASVACGCHVNAMSAPSYAPNSESGLVFGKLVQLGCADSFEGREVRVWEYEPGAVWRFGDTVYETEADRYGFFALTLPPGTYELHSYDFACPIPIEAGSTLVWAGHVVFDARSGGANYIGHIVVGGAAQARGPFGGFAVNDDFAAAQGAFKARFRHGGTLSNGVARVLDRDGKSAAGGDDGCEPASPPPGASSALARGDLLDAIVKGSLRTEERCDGRILHGEVRFDALRGDHQQAARALGYTEGSSVRLWQSPSGAIHLRPPAKAPSSAPAPDDTPAADSAPATTEPAPGDALEAEPKPAEPRPDEEVDPK